MSTKTCIQCGTEVKGRSDKKFCSSECRNEYNNEKYRDETHEIRRINKILKKNREILKHLNPDGKKVTTRERLLHEGLHFEYFTSTFTNQQGRVYYYCYDYGYCPGDDDKVLLVEKTKFD